MPDRPRDDLDCELTDEQSAARDEFWRFAQTEIAPGAQARDREECTSRELVERIAAEGYLGVMAPEEYSGGAMDSIMFGLLNAELGRACSSARTSRSGLLSVRSRLARVIPA